MNDDSRQAARHDAGSVSVVAGGPLHDLLCRIGCSDAGMGRVGRRIALAITVLWLPLLVLSLIDGRAWDGAQVPFLKDIDTALRYMLALPLMMISEALVHDRTTVAVRRFVQRGMVAPDQDQAFRRIIDSMRRIVASPTGEGVLLLFVYLVGIGGIWRQVSAQELDTWYGTVEQGRLQLRLPGLWMQWVSVPLFLFLILRWYYRLLLWAVLLWRLSRLRLALQPLHPDQAGGLGFLSQATLSFVPLLIAQGTMASGWIAGQIFHSGAQLMHFKLDLAAATVLSLCVVLVPLLPFVPALAEAKRLGLAAYGALAMDYAADFKRKWLHDGARPAGSPLGDADFQSLADLGNSYKGLTDMRVFPFGLRAVAKLAAAFLAPVAPLALTMVSADELLDRVLALLL
jgi:hypothetical protein